MRIYVAGPLSTKPAGDSPSYLSAGVIEYIKNMHRMIAVAIRLQKRGHAPYVPALDILMGIQAGDWERDDYQSISISFLEVCDALFCIAHSEGVDKEIARADELDIPVYFNEEDIPDAERTN